MFAEDFSVLFETTDGFATPATLAGGAIVPVIFDNAYQAGMGLVESTGPVVLAKTTDVAGLVQGSTLTINAVVYSVTGVQPDGTGVTTLQLRS